MTEEKNTLTLFGKEVKVKLIEKEIKQRELAKKIGISESFLCQIIYGYRPGEKYIDKIAMILDIDLSKYVA